MMQSLEGLVSHQAMLTPNATQGFPFVVQASFAFVLCVGMLFQPFSPRWLVQAGRSEDARQVLARVRPEQRVRAELVEIEDSLAQDLRGSNASFREIFGRRYIKRTTIGVLLMMLQQTTGVRTRDRPNGYLQVRRG